MKVKKDTARSSLPPSPSPTLLLHLHRRIFHPSTIKDSIIPISSLPLPPHFPKTAHNFTTPPHLPLLLQPLQRIPTQQGKTYCSITGFFPPAPPPPPSTPPSSPEKDCISDDPDFELHLSKPPPKKKKKGKE